MPRLLALLRFRRAASIWCWALFPWLGHAGLEFVYPLRDAHFRQGQEIFISLQAQVDDDVITSAEVLVDGQPLGTAVYCCPLCPCAHPFPGMVTTLQIPVPIDPQGPPLPNPWWRWRTATPGVHVLTARASGEKGTTVEAPPVTVTVTAYWLDLQVQRTSEGDLAFVIPEGSLVEGGFAMELSHDLQTWTRLGEFSPGNVAAFYRDHPDSNDARPRFYRAVPAKAQR